MGRVAKTGACADNVTVRADALEVDAGHVAERPTTRPRQDETRPAGTAAGVPLVRPPGRPPPTTQATKIAASPTSRHAEDVGPEIILAGAGEGPFPYGVTPPLVPYRAPVGDGDEADAPGRRPVGLKGADLFSFCPPTAYFLQLFRKAFFLRYVEHWPFGQMYLLNRGRLTD